MPFVYLVGVGMRKKMFPVSWLIQSRLADVATIVDENINGVRVVKSFAAEQQQLTRWRRPKGPVGLRQERRPPGPWAPIIENLPQVGLAMVLLFGGYLVIHGHMPSAPSSPSTPTC